MRPTMVHLAALLPLWLMACPDPDGFSVQEQRAEIAVPEALDFGDQPVTLAAPGVLTLQNAGTAPLEATLSVEGLGADAYVLDTTTLTVDRKSSAEVTLTFTPSDFVDYDAEVVIQSNDEDDPEVRVPLVGRGIPAPLPDISVSSLTLDFGVVDPGPGIAQFEIRNDGLEDLVLGTLARTGSGRFDLALDPSGTTIAPGDAWPVVVTYAPQIDPTSGPLGDDGTLTITSNDPDEPEVEVLLLGNGGADYDYPVATFNCPTATVDPPTFVDFDAIGSTDPEGHEPLTYAWSIADQPAGSQAYLTSVSGEQTSLWVDSAGDYAIELAVTNAIDTVSAPVRCDLAAVPGEDLHVELAWDTSRADLDLHLARGDAEIFDAPDDTTWCNETPDWGNAGTSDDPRLDLDDRSGFGPENIVIPSPINDDYTVRVHYFDDNGDADVTATVRVWVQGSLAFTASRLMSLDEVWDVALIDWGNLSVGGIPADSYPSPRRSCF